MINKINFTGRVIWGENVRNLANDNEVNAIKKYAKQNSCDVIVCNRDYYIDDTGAYDCIVLKQNEIGTNQVIAKVFDFKHPEKCKERKLNFKI